MGSSILVALSNHRPEIVPLAVAKMRRFDTVVLEEPPEADFRAMLAGKVAIKDYLMAVDSEYPQFSRAMCRAMRDLCRKGISILQIEPYLSRLMEIHERLGEGLRPEMLRRDVRLWPVYQMEREATQTLVAFYKAFATGNFDTTLAAVKRFARSDAKRFWMRDRLRAQAIADAATDGRVYVEAGQMHVGLASLIRRQVGRRAAVTADYLASAVISAWSGPRMFFGPGDVLTLLYIFNPRFNGKRADLLAARALVQNKLLVKNEISTGLETFPHTRDELESARIVQRLGLEDCRLLLPIVSRLGTRQARQVAMAAAGVRRDFSA